ncbi:electron transfer flavoprotein subunit beta/FixA family protein [Siminovitchia terrae]|uniref:Electron transfer flavoprotein subunit beta n=1 Tax=Siminovitchia terrae TaxID=1914933 RepID=A0A429X8N3_SIMTE|nr:electron transfer flavoprotein subunit beta/FixA family protein [Siminovitchia terrae]RST59815.1 electron transfer flavoprotein subunit beta/FixA family protein [Siminovitchia terrae]
MNIFVMMKRTFDTEEKLSIQNGEIVDTDAEYIINPYDEYAIEEAVQLRDVHGGQVTVLTVGDEEAEKELRTALAMGCDQAVLINDEELEDGDQMTTASLIAAYLQDKEFDLVLGGNVAIDGGSGQVGPRVAELLGIVQVAAITELCIENGKAEIVRDVEGDEERLKLDLPLLATAQQGLNEPRYPSLPGIMKAKKKPLYTLDWDELDIDENELETKTETIEVFAKPDKQAGKMLEGELRTQVKELLSLLTSEAKVIS